MRIIRLLIYEGDEDHLNKTIEKSVNGTLMIQHDLFITAEILENLDTTNLLDTAIKLERIITQHETNLLNINHNNPMARN